MIRTVCAMMLKSAFNIQNKAKNISQLYALSHIDLTRRFPKLFPTSTDEKATTADEKATTADEKATTAGEEQTTASFLVQQCEAALYLPLPLGFLGRAPTAY